MFCLGCGAETPPRATSCPVCGRELRGATGEVQWTVSPTASIPAAPVPRGSIAYAPQTSAPSIRAGDLDVPGLPRDGYGRALLVTAIAMAADLLLPWINNFGQRQAPAQLGLPILPVVVALVLAIVPLVRPSFRSQPPLAVLPVVVGGMLLGLSLVAWGIMTYASYQVSQQPQQFGPDGSLVSQQPQTVGPDVGVYLFILGSAVLIVTGYHVFLEAARKSAPATVNLATAVIPPPPVAAVPASSDSGAISPALQYGASAAESATGAETAPVPAVRPADVTGGVTDGEAPKPPPVPLPGSAAWHEAPKQPMYSRPSPLTGGWQRQPRPHR